MSPVLGKANHLSLYLANFEESTEEGSMEAIKMKRYSMIRDDKQEEIRNDTRF